MRCPLDGGNNFLSKRLYPWLVEALWYPLKNVSLFQINTFKKYVKYEIEIF